jgi:hypothetical protein
MMWVKRDGERDSWIRLTRKRSLILGSVLGEASAERRK